MGRIKLKLKNWPFEKGKRIQLIWIGEPFKENNKWMIDTYFCDGKVTKKVIQDWANIHFLSIDKYYTDGDLNSGEIIDDEGIMKTMNIDLSNIIPKYNELDWSIKKSTYKSKSRTFSFWKNNILYTIPIIEIVRAILAPNTFMLNTILYNDIWEDYFTYEFEDRKLNIAFTSQYRTSYLKNEYYNQLAWMISNEEILRMCNEIGFNMLSEEKLIFDFNITKFNVSARVKKNKHGFTIMEILKVNRKKINIDELKIYHPGFKERVKNNEAKLRTYIYLENKDDNRIIDNSVYGAKNYDERINNELIIQEYINVPKVKKEKHFSEKLRIKEDNSTKRYVLEDDNLRTLSSEGGMKKANGIESIGIDETIVPSEFNNFIHSLRVLEKLDWIKKVNINIVMLPLGRKFSYLSNGVDRRKCLIAEILKADGNILGIIEVQRENKALSILILKFKSKKGLQFAYEDLLKGLVRESGKWSTSAINKLNNIGISIYRKRHMNNEIDNIIEEIGK